MKLDMTLILGLAGLIVIAAGLEARSEPPHQSPSIFKFTVQNISCPTIDTKAMTGGKLEAPVGSLVLVLI